MKLLIDMNLSPRWCSALAKNGIASVHWIDVGPASAPDKELLGHAMTQDLIILTHDLDFGAILAATGVAGPSVIQLRATDLSPEAGADLVARAAKACEAELEAGALLTVETGRTRVTLLPLRR